MLKEDFRKAFKDLSDLRLRLSVELHYRRTVIVGIRSTQEYFTIYWSQVCRAYDGVKRITSNKQRWRAESLSVRHGIGALPLIDSMLSTFAILVFLEDKKGQKISRVSFRDNNWQRALGRKAHFHQFPFRSSCLCSSFRPKIAGSESTPVRECKCATVTLISRIIKQIRIPRYAPARA